MPFFQFIKHFLSYPHRNELITCNEPFTPQSHLLICIEIKILMSSACNYYTLLYLIKTSPKTDT